VTLEKIHHGFFGGTTALFVQPSKVSLVLIILNDREIQDYFR